MTTTIEETYCIIDKRTGVGAGLAILASRLDGRGAMAQELRILPTRAAGLEGGDYALSFVKMAMLDDAAPRRLATLRAANQNRKGGA